MNKSVENGVPYCPIAAYIMRQNIQNIRHTAENRCTSVFPFYTWLPFCEQHGKETTYRTGSYAPFWLLLFSKNHSVLMWMKSPNFYSHHAFLSESHPVQDMAYIFTSLITNLHTQKKMTTVLSFFFWVHSCSALKKCTAGPCVNEPIAAIEAAYCLWQNCNKKTHKSCLWRCWPHTWTLMAGFFFLPSPPAAGHH